MKSSRRRVIGVQPTGPRAQSQFQMVRRDIKSAKSSRVPALLLNDEIFTQFDSKKENDSSMVLTLRSETKLSTPRSIQTFIDKQATNSVANDAARTIQRTWKIYRFRKRTFYFLDFLKKIRLNKKSHTFASWKLALLPPASTAIHYYRMFNDVNVKSGISPPSAIRSAHMSFDGYMKTGILQTDPRVSEDMLIKSTKIMMKPLLLQCFNSWNTIAQEKAILKRASESIMSLSLNRYQFGNMFWTYHVWKRWVQYRKSKRKGIRGKIPRSFYLPEWSFFLARKNEELRLREEADELFKKNIFRRTCTALHTHALQQIANTQTISDIKKKINHSIMGKAYRALLIMTAFRRLRFGIMSRTVKFWYKHVDRTRIHRMFLDVYRHRRILSTLNDTFRKWRLNIVEEGAGIALVHEKIRENRTKLFRFGYLLCGDFIHYTQMTAFYEWKKIIAMKKRAQRFKTWVLSHAKQQALKKYIFDCFRIKADKPIDRSNYQPFILDARPQSSKKKRKILDILSKKKVTFDYYTHNVFCAKVASNNIEQYEFCQEKGIEYWKADDARDFFLYIVYLVFKYSLKTQSDVQAKLKELKDFRIKNMLFNQTGVAELRLKQEREDQEMKRIITERNLRDNTMILKMERYEAALAYQQVDPKFTVCPLNEEDEEIQKYRERHLKPKKKHVKKKKGAFSARRSSLSPSKKKKKGKKKNSEEGEEPKAAEEEHSDHEKHEEEEEYDAFDEELTVKSEKGLDNSSGRFQLGTFPMSDSQLNLTRDTSKARIKRHSVRPKNELPVHPLLGPIPKIRDKTLANIRQFRRDPNQIFIEKTVRRNINTRQLQATSSNISLSRQSSTYESFIPIETKNGLLKVQSIHDIRLLSIDSDDEKERTETFDEIPTIAEEGSTDEEVSPDQASMPQTPIKLTQSTRVSMSPGFLPKTIYFGSSASSTAGSTPVKQAVDEKPKTPQKDKDKNISKIQENISADISLDNLADSFLQDPGYLNRDKDSEVGYLTNKYFSLLEILLGKKKKRPKLEVVSQRNVQNMFQNNFPIVAMKISKLLRKLNEPFTPSKKPPPQTPPKPLTDGEQQLVERRERKLQRKSLYQMKDEVFDTVQGIDGKNYKKSNCPEFANVYFDGDEVLTNAPWESRVEQPKVSATDINYVSLPSATITVKGFENIPALAKLSQNIADFLKPHEEEEEFDENGEIIPPKQLMTNFYDLMTEIAQKYLQKEVDRSMQGEISQFVDTSGIEPEASREVTPQITTQQTPRRQFIITKSREFNHKAFSTVGRRKRPPSVMERKLTFTSEMLRAIKEGAEIMRMQGTDLAKKTKTPTDSRNGLDRLRKRIQERQREINSQSSTQPSTQPVSPRGVHVKKVKEIEVGGGEVALTIGGREKRENTSALHQTARPATGYVFTRTLHKEDVSDVVVSSRPKTAQTSRQKTAPVYRTTIVQSEQQNTARSTSQSSSQNAPQSVSNQGVSQKIPKTSSTGSIVTVTKGSAKKAGNQNVPKLATQNAVQTVHRQSSLFQTAPPQVKTTRANAKSSLIITRTPVSSSRTAPAEHIPNISIASLDTSKMSLRVQELHVGKRKPQFTKMVPSQPRQPETLVYDMPKAPPKPISSRMKDQHWTVDIERKDIVTDQDVDFLMFVTPYIISPDFLLQLFEEEEEVETPKKSKGKGKKRVTIM